MGFCMLVMGRGRERGKLKGRAREKEGDTMGDALA
jgi:hypothetical protein